MIFQLFLIVMVLLCGGVQGKDLGAFGPTFPILEKSLIGHILERLKTLEHNGGLQKHNDIITKKMMERIQNPEPVKGLSHTRTPKRYTFDPSIVVSKDLTDHTGKVFYTKGTRVNPLHTRPLTKPLIFIDGDESHHHTWLQKQLIQHPNAKIILVKGNPFKGMDHYDRPLFYDQGGTLTSKLGIRHVPAKVTQAGDVLQIDEECADDD